MKPHCQVSDGGPEGHGRGDLSRVRIHAHYTCPVSTHTPGENYGQHRKQEGVVVSSSSPHQHSAKSEALLLGPI